MSAEGRSSKSDFKYCSVAEGKSKILFGRILSRSSSPKQPKYLDPCFSGHNCFYKRCQSLSSLATIVEDGPWSMSAHTELVGRSPAPLFLQE